MELRKNRKKTEKKNNKKPNSQSLLERIRENNITEIEPVYNPENGCNNCYPVIEALIGSDVEIEPLLEEIVESGEVVKELFDKTILCPKCDSQYISTRYNCPYCNSFDIEKSSLIEHTKCGYMDVEQNFHKNKKLVCPKCNSTLEKADFDYKKAGVWCKCNNCNKNFDIPTPSHFCRKCGTISTFEEVNLKNVYTYKVKDSPKTGSSASEFAFVAINNFLEKKGWKVKSPASIKGKSGAEYSFDIAAFKGSKKDKTIVIDVAVSSEEIVAEQPVVALFAKIFDVSPKKSVLVTVPKLSKDGKKMAELYNIQIIEAKNQTQVIDRLKEIL
jgi:Zn finger protein HypA/HybF involved in hydrogenase expression